MRTNSKAFTLLELLLVMLIMVMIMGTSVAMYFKMRSTAEMRGATTRIKAGLSFARQRAVMMQEKVTVYFSPAQNYFFPSNSIGWVGETNYLPDGVTMTSVDAPGKMITFYPNGNSKMAGVYTVVIKHKMAPQTNTIKIYNLTGMVEIQ